jgi:rhodanese-related sulfurtransferase
MKAAFSFVGLAAGILALGALVARAESTSEEPFGRLTVDQVEKGVGDRSLSVFDNNGKERYTQGHVPSAKWLSIADIKESDLPADKDKAVVFYCGNEQCMACHSGAKAAIKYGFKKVYIMPAGIAGWEKAGKPVEKG